MNKKYNIGDIVNNKLVIGYDGSLYVCKCLSCGAISTRGTTNLEKRGCRTCYSKSHTDWSDITSIYKNHPELKKFDINFDTRQGTKFEITCPDCGYTKYYYIGGIIKYKHLPCPICRTNYSFPNRFAYCICQQLNLNFTPEKKFSWSKNYRYDIYLEDFNTIIELHGLQHYQHTTLAYLDKVKQRDNTKYNLAIANGITNYLIIDCRQSTLDFIRDSFLQSDFFSIIKKSVDSVDFMKCLYYAVDNKTKAVCDYYAKTKLAPAKLSKLFNMSAVTIRSYLLTGNRLGWCRYNPKDNMRKRGKESAEAHKKRIYCLEQNTIFNYVGDLADYYSFPKSSWSKIRRAAKTFGTYHKWHYCYVCDMPSLDLEIVGYEAGEGKYEGMLGAFIVQFKDNTVKVGSGLSDDQRKEFWDIKEDLIGRIVEVKYKEISKDKTTGKESLQFPIFQQLREVGKEPSLY